MLKRSVQNAGDSRAEARDGLIASKLAAGRTRDLADVEEIWAAMESTATITAPETATNPS